MKVRRAWKTHLKAAFTENVGLKALALMASMGLFTVVHGSEAAQRSLYVPVVAELPDPAIGKMLVSELPDRVKLTLSGSRSVLNSITSIEAVQIDLSGADQFYYFEPEIFGLPAGINVTVVPSTLSLSWEDRVERTLPVRPQSVGEVPAGLKMVAAPAAEPSRVHVWGPRSVVQLLDEVLVEPVDVAVAGVGKHERSVRFSSLPSGVQPSSVREITVRFAIVARENERKLPHLEVAAIGPAMGIKIRPAHVHAVISGPEKALAELDAEHVVPVVRLEGLTLPAGGNVAVPVEIRGLPAGLRAARVEPSEVLVSQVRASPARAGQR